MQSSKGQKVSNLSPCRLEAMSPAGHAREVMCHHKQTGQVRHLRTGQEARELSSSRQEAPEAVKKVRRACVGNASVMGLRNPMA